MTKHHADTLRRRRVLAGIVAGSGVGVAGCLGGNDTARDDIEPVALAGEVVCDQCGMIIEDQPGTVGQIHFADDTTEGGRPARFCSGTCTYTYRFDAEDAGRDPHVTFLTDYTRVEYEVFEAGDDVLLTSHVEADAFAQTTDLTVIAGSDVIGAMGPDLVPFSEDEDVDEFVGAHGGTPLDAEAVDRATVDGS